PRTVMPRHRTLRGAIDWSYELLDHDERTLFVRFAVFPADFDYAAAQAVCTPDATAAPGLTVLPRLGDKSLVSAVGRGPRRYRLLETLRAYAAERLATTESASATRELHAVHYLGLAEQAAEQLRGLRQRAWLDRLTIEQSNLRAGLAHHLAT